MSSNNKDQEVSFEQLLTEEVTKKVDNIDLIEKLGNVKKIKQDKVSFMASSMDKELSKIKKDAATRDTKEEVVDHVSSSFVHLCKPNDILSYQSEGVQPKVMIKLKKGEYKEIDCIDLHGKTIEEAYSYVKEYIGFARRQGYRCILIVHGKGDREYLKQKATLKSYVAHWLKQMPEILAYHSAPEYKGGAGALLVLLKKSDKDSIMNREFHALRTRTVAYN